MRLKHSFLSLFQIAFAAGFLFIFFAAFGYMLIMKDASGFGRIAWGLAVFSAVTLFFFVRMTHWLDRFNEAQQTGLALLLFFAAIAAELWIILQSRDIVPPLIDGGHTYVEARYLLLHHYASKSVYFSVYPNNVPVTILRYLLYRFFALFHFRNYMLIDRLFDGGVLVLCMLVSWRIVCKQFNRKMGNMLLLLFLTCFPLFFYTVYFYTDTTIMCIPVLLLYFWQLYSETAKMRYILLLSLSFGIGYLIRPNIILFLPALAIYMCFTLRFKRMLVNLVVIGTVLAACIAGGQSYEHHLGFTTSSRYTMPNVHWVMLGLSSVGQYTTSDFHKTYDQPTLAAKKAKDMAIIRQRVAHDGAEGLIKLWAIKTVRTWSVSAHGYYWYTEFTNKNTPFYAYIFGSKKELVLFICQVFYIVSLLLMLVSVLSYFRTKKVTLNLLIQICLFGNLIFYTFIWEAEPRYSLLFSPYILISAVFGLSECRVYLDKWQQMIAQSGYRPIVLKLCAIPVILLLGAIILCGAANQFALTSNRLNHPDYRINLPHGQGNCTATVDNQQVISQTFHVSAPFNRIGLKVDKISGNGMYQLQLMKMHPHKMIELKRFHLDPKTALSNGNFQIITIPTESIIHPQAYRLSIRKSGGTPNAQVQYAVNGRGFDQRDIYPDGMLMRNHQKAGKEDLVFQVYNRRAEPYLPRWLYWLLIGSNAIFVLEESIRDGCVRGRWAKNG
ncbi:MAG: glycosyltransferase family 39 protein [Sporolactobacillus sp.]